MSAGNLHFANVKEFDWNPSKPICCVLFNTELRALTQGGGQLVRPQMISGSGGQPQSACRASASPGAGFMNRRRLCQLTAAILTSDLTTHMWVL